MKRQPVITAIATLFTAAVVILGYIMLGLLPAMLFVFGFLGGYILWLLIPTKVSFAAIKVPYFLTLAFFVLHKIEEREMDFFPRLSEITGVPVPEASFLIILLYALAAAWLLIPYLVSRGHAFGYYLAWTFFTAMGVTELAHFFLPFLTLEPYAYFPGMASVVLLAPTAWWGIWRLSGKHQAAGVQ